MIGPYRTIAWALPLAALCFAAAGQVGAQSPDRVNEYTCSSAAPGSDAPPAAICQAETPANPPPESPTTVEPRKQYLREALSKSKVAGKRLDNTASGFFVSEKGDLITTAGVVSGCAAISVSPMYGELTLAKVVATDDDAGIALLHVDISSPGVATFIPSEGVVNRGQVYLLGFPILGSVTSEPALTPVRVLNAQRTVHDVLAMLIDGDVRSGYNGGPILDSGGGVIGVLTPGKAQFSGSTDAPVDSMGMGVPSEFLRAFLEKLGIDHETGMAVPPKTRERIVIASRPFAAQIGCWQ